MELHVRVVDGEEELVILAASGAALEHVVYMLGGAQEFTFFTEGGVEGIESRGLRFEGFADFVAFADFFGSGHANTCPDAGTAFDEAIGFQGLERLSDGQETHAEFGGQAAAGQWGA
jgi:hypothetical protein